MMRWSGWCREMATLPQLGPLGEVCSDNNSRFYLAGRVIEIASGKPFETAVRELVFDPLGLAASSRPCETSCATRGFIWGTAPDRTPRACSPPAR